MNYFTTVRYSLNEYYANIRNCEDMTGGRYSENVLTQR